MHSALSKDGKAGAQRYSRARGNALWRLAGLVVNERRLDWIGVGAAGRMGERSPATPGSSAKPTLAVMATALNPALNLRSAFIFRFLLFIG